MIFLNPARLLLTLVVACCGAVHAAGWPEHPIRIFVAFPPGGSVDVYARAMSERLSASLGQPVIIENRPGAGGTIAAASVAQSKPDGYTVLFGASSELVALPVIRPSTVRYKMPDDFSFIGLGMLAPVAIVVSGDSKVDSVESFISAARTRDVKIAYSGAGGPAQLGMELIKIRAGIPKMIAVPYPGIMNAVADIISGRIDGYAGNYAALRPLLDNGKLKLLAVASESRLSAFPQIKTFKEQGVDFVQNGIFGMVAPAGVSPEVLKKLSDAFSAALRDPAIQQVVRQTGGEIKDLPLDKFRAFIVTEMQWYRDGMNAIPGVEKLLVP